MPSVTIGALTFIYRDDLLGLFQEINVDASVDFLDGQVLIDAIRQAEASDIGRSFSKIADASGKAILSAGVRVGVTIELLDNWKIYTLKNSGAFTVGGANVVKTDSSTIFVDNPSVTYNRDSAVASTQVSTGGGGGGAFTAADVAIAVRTNLAIELARVDASIASRSSGSAIVAIDSKLDEIKTNTTGGDCVVL